MERETGSNPRHPAWEAILQQGQQGAVRAQIQENRTLAGRIALAAPSRIFLLMATFGVTLWMFLWMLARC
jgi:hypothetical protein